MALLPRDSNADADADADVDVELPRRRRLVLHVLTMDREASLARLLRSLSRAEYPGGWKADVVVHVDRLGQGSGASERVVAAATEAKSAWTRGEFEVRVWPVKKGIVGQWIDCWAPDEETESEEGDAIHVMLEDDLEVSPHFASWFVEAHAAFANDASVASFTGQRAQLRAKGEGTMAEVLHRMHDPLVFKYRLFSTWSFSPKRAVWKAFRSWFAKRRNDPAYNPVLGPGIKPSEWYQHFRSVGKADGMWSIHFLKFMDEQRLYTVYPWVDAGRVTVVQNHREPGLHYDGKAEAGVDFPLTLKAWTRADFPPLASVACLGWDGAVEPCSSVS